MDYIKKQFGKKVQLYRELKNLSQAELARLSDSDQPYISDIENGKANPTITFIQKLATALGVPLKDIIGGKDQ